MRFNPIYAFGFVVACALLVVAPGEGFTQSGDERVDPVAEAIIDTWTYLTTESGIDADADLILDRRRIAMNEHSVDGWSSPWSDNARDQLVSRTGAEVGSAQAAMTCPRDGNPSECRIRGARGVIAASEATVRGDSAEVTVRVWIESPDTTEHAVPRYDFIVVLERDRDRWNVVQRKLIRVT